jgi:hypothetical protein
MEYLAISTTGEVIDLGTHDNVSDATEHAERGPWNIAHVFTKDEGRKILSQLEIRKY